MQDKRICVRLVDFCIDEIDSSFTSVSLFGLINLFRIFIIIVHVIGTFYFVTYPFFGLIWTNQVGIVHRALYKNAIDKQVNIQRNNINAHNETTANIQQSIKALKSNQTKQQKDS